MKLSIALRAVAKALSITGLGIAGSSLLQGNVYIAGTGVVIAIAGEAIDGAAMVVLLNDPGA